VTNVRAACLGLAAGAALLGPGLACGDRDVSSCAPAALTIHAGDISGDVGGCAGRYTSLGTAKPKIGSMITVSIHHDRKTKEATLPRSTAGRVVSSVSRSADGRTEKFRVVGPGTADLVVPTVLCPEKYVIGMATPGRSPGPPDHLCQVLHVEVAGP
jgi:hypothetical protein